MGVGAANKVLGEYNIIKTIGQGAFSKVKLAVHRESGEKVGCLIQVAIKIVDKKMMAKMVEKQKKNAEERRKKRYAQELKKRQQQEAVKRVSTIDGHDIGSILSASVGTSCSSGQEYELSPRSSEIERKPADIVEIAPAFMKDLQNEVKMMMKLNHPNIIKIYQVIDSAEECYIVMLLI